MAGAGRRGAGARLEIGVLLRRCELLSGYGATERPGRGVYRRGALLGAFFSVGVFALTPETRADTTLHTLCQRWRAHRFFQAFSTAASDQWDALEGRGSGGGCARPATDPSRADPSRTDFCVRGFKASNR